MNNRMHALAWKLIVEGHLRRSFWRFHIGRGILRLLVPGLKKANVLRQIRRRLWIRLQIFIVRYGYGIPVHALGALGIVGAFAWAWCSGRTVCELMAIYREARRQQKG